MNSRRIEPEVQGLQAQGLSLPGYGRDLAVRPYPLSLRHRDAVHALAAEGVSSFLARMMAQPIAGPRLH